MHKKVILTQNRYLYDRNTGEWTVDKYLADVEERYGGIDSVLLWQNYPNIGIDDRNQFDMLDSLDNIDKLIADFHDAGVRVILPYNPWDQFTRNTGRSDVETLVELVVKTNSDGFNGDTMDGVNRSYWEESLRLGHPIAIEPEIMMSQVDTLAYNVMSWGYSST